MADMQAGVGPFLGVFLLAHGWQSGRIGSVMTIGGVAGVLTRGNQVTSADLNFLADANPTRGHLRDWPDEDLPSAVARLEEMLIRSALERCLGNRSEAAKILNINRQLLYTKLKRYGLTGSDDDVGVDE